jgi:hypothetical protein
MHTATKKASKLHNHKINTHYSTNSLQHQKYSDIIKKHFLAFGDNLSNRCLHSQAGAWNEK